jgi:hypothetical protein
VTWKTQQFCKRGHDTFQTGRRRSGLCKLCSCEHARRYSTGWTPEQYDAVWQAQGFCCAICSRPRAEGEPQFHADHNHTTRAARGILCPACNQAIGLLGDSPDRARAAADYLARHE